MTDKKIILIGNVIDDFFCFIYRKNNINTLEHYLKQFNPDDYYIYKSSNTFREVSKEDFYEFKYAGYIFFKKELYDNKEINNWIDFIRTISKGHFTYLNKPFPPIEIKQKINIIQ